MSPSTGSSVTASMPQPGDAEVDWSRIRLGVDAAPTMYIARWTVETGCWSASELVPYGPLNLLPAAQVLNYGQSIFEGMKAYRADSPVPEPAPIVPAAPGLALAAVADGAASSAGADTAAAATAAVAVAREPSSTSSDCGSDPDASLEQRGRATRVLLFRPRDNAARFAAGAERMCMPPVPEDMFIEAVHAVARANRQYVPPASKGSLYIRPLLLGTGGLLGISPATEYLFIVYAVPVGTRAKEGKLSALDFLIHDRRHRAAPRGVGSTKAAGNYSPCLLAQAEARAQGCHDCLYLDARSDSHLEEGTGCNVFVVHGRRVTTPPAAGSILPGITRASLLRLAEALGYEACEEPVSVEEAMKADEVFVSGTAMVVQPVGSLTFQGTKVRFGDGARDRGHEDLAPAQAAVAAAAEGDAKCGDGKSAASGVVMIHCALEDSSRPATPDGEEAQGADAGQAQQQAAAAAKLLAAHSAAPERASLAPGVGLLTQRLYTLLTDIQYGRAPDPYGWTEQVEMEGPVAGPLAGTGVAASDAADGCAGALPNALSVCGSFAVPRTVFQDPNLE